ncbi:tryptophan synthase beta subunit-like PLP-dependent enzyme [Nadsonia fulvescens var. elongata DSM 6958]|uniref:Threonine synthase n=1 Tax=Nadsonia fulvescens var. elongata DSM 6958 TaxID=857566 RepID=A0A1E3PIJ9_9ASCO|nr:tryptophan synthase beta subunit-like PLP-dependent enzyme [Nadsonia fulvescens var. elongata DSM 6958]
MSSQRYFSTRSSAEPHLTFEQAIIQGLAPDGGLYIPTAIPSILEGALEKWSNLSFAELAYEIMSLYISTDEIPSQDLKSLCKKSYSTFRAADVTPITTLQKDSGLYLLELFHGPTYAFKDVALQFVGNLFEYFLQRKNAGKAEDAADRDTITVVGATSGDTGSAAIYGLRNKKDVSVFILYPTGRVSPIQEAQMTTVLDKNVHTISLKGTFDDCQDIVKSIFGDVEFNSKYHVGAVNSINWARILAQITYYYHSYFQLSKNLGSTDFKARFVVPTGNFGDILAGFYAKRMGLPVDGLVIATNANDILDRFVKSGSYSKSETAGAAPVVHATLSPAMDILVSSNFERFLWYLARENLASTNEEAGSILASWMSDLKTKGTFSVPEVVLEAAKREFTSERISDEETAATIKSVYQKITPKYILDPHSAVGVAASLRRIEEDSKAGVQDVKYVSLSTAHPAKFSDAVEDALGQEEGFSFESDVLPQEFKDFSTKEKKNLFVDAADIEKVKAVIIEELAKEKL